MAPTTIKGRHIAFAAMSMTICAAVCHAGAMYWSEPTTKRILRSNLGGDFIQTVVTDTSEPHSLVFDPASLRVYWHAVPDTAAQSLRATSLAGSVSSFSVVVGGPLYPLTGVAVDSDHQHVYWNAYSQVFRVNTDGTGLYELPIPMNFSQLAGVAVDEATQAVYLARNETDTIGGGIYRFDGVPGVLTPIVTAVGYPLAICLDPVHGKVYWTEGSIVPGTVRRTNLDGSQVEDIVTGIPGSWLPAIAVDPTGGKVYWVERLNSFEQSGSIRRANLDGSSIETIHGGLTSVHGLTLDLRSASPICGDAICEGPETSLTCLPDCPPACGDGTCDDGENCSNCPPDCSGCDDPVCGNSLCEPGENGCNCPTDCSTAVCGNSVCDPGENPCSCPCDCQDACEVPTLATGGMTLLAIAILLTGTAAKQIHGGWHLPKP